jgi:MFS family permease
MQLYHFYHGHKARRLRFSDFWMYELSMWLHTLAHALISIFIPILMLKAGYPLGEVIVFYVIYNIIDVFCTVAARRLVGLFGARVVIGLATLLVIVFFWTFLNLASPSWHALLTLALFAALYDGFYWVAHIFLFMQSRTQAPRAGRGIGVLYAVRQCALMLGPIIGAGLLVFVSTKALLIVTIAAFVLSLVPLWLVDEFPDKPKGKRLSFKKFFAHPRGRHIYLSAMLYAVHDTSESIIFPLFIYVTFGTLRSVALVPVAMSLAAMVAAFLLGGVGSRRRLLAISLGAGLIALVWMTRLSMGGPSVYYASIFAIGILAYFVLVPLDSLLFEYGHEVGDPLTASMYRNVAYMGTNIFLYSILAVLVTVFEPGFALAAASLFGLLLYNVAWLLFPSVRGRA